MQTNNNGDASPPQSRAQQSADRATETFGKAADEVAAITDSVQKAVDGKVKPPATPADSNQPSNPKKPSGSNPGSAGNSASNPSGSAGDDVGTGTDSPTQTGTVAVRDEAPQLLRDVQDIAWGKIALIIVITYFVIWISRRLLPRLAAVVPSQFRLYPLSVIPIIRLLALTAAVLSILPEVINNLFENFLIIAGTASVALGFAFKDYVSSLIAGVIAVFERPYRTGDWVRIGEHYGEVRGIGMRSLALQTPGDDRVTVPHSHLWTENVSNSNDGTRTLMCVVDFYVHPDHDAALLRSKLTDVAATSPYLNDDMPIVVMLADEPIGTHYKVKLYPFDLRDQFQMVSDITVRGKQAIRAAGAKFATAAAISQNEAT